MSARMRVLHTEVGGRYGGSLRALELYLQFANHSHFEHDLLLYYPMPEADRLLPLVGGMHVLFDSVPEWLSNPKPMNQKLSGALKSSVVGAALSELREWAELAGSLGTGSRIRRLMKEYSYGLVHFNNTFTYQADMLLAARWAGVPAISHVRNPVAELAFNRTLMRSLKLVVTVSKNYEEQLRAWSTKVPVHTCHDGITVPAADAAAAAAIRASLAAPGEILIGSVGRLEEQKGYVDLIRAAKVVVGHRPDVRFAIAGDGPLRPELQQLISSLDLADRVQLCGFRTDIPDFVSALDMFVSSSHWEGLPIAVVEAMLLERPVVATDVGGVSEVVKPGETGYLSPSRNPEALAAEILRALEQQETQPGRFLEAARRVAAELTDPEKSARRFEQLLGEVLPL